MPRRAPRRTRQAAEGEVEETELAVYEHGAEAADEVAKANIMEAEGSQMKKGQSNGGNDPVH